MRRYETFVIIDPDLADEPRDQLLEKTKTLIESTDGVTIELDQWGARKLAYEIKKKKRGYYVRIDYCGTSELVNEMERTFRLDDRYMKFMTILLSEDVDMEKIQEEIEEKKKTALQKSEALKESEENKASTTSDESVEEEKEEADATEDSMDAEA